MFTTTTEAVATSFTNVSCYFDATFFTEDGVGDALSIAIASTLGLSTVTFKWETSDQATIFL